MSIFQKLISGGDGRRSRFHTADDMFIGLGDVVTQTPLVLGQKLRNRLAGRRPETPWWPLPAIEAVEKKLSRDMTAIEFGSGSSTLWIARRVRSLIAREHDAHWAEITRKRLEAGGLSNCEIQHRTGGNYYALDRDQRFDFAVVDGQFRWKCLETLSERMEPGGLIYFDNSDSDKDAHHYSAYGLEGSHHAQAVVRDLEHSHTVRVEIVHGMINGELFAGSAMLISFDAETTPQAGWQIWR